MNKLAISAAILLFATACSDAGGDAERQKADAAKAARALALAPGQWETTAEVTRITQQDKAPQPAINTPVGTRTTASACLTEADVKQPPAVLLAGSDQYSCTYGNNYLSSGSLNASLTCTRKGLSGEVRMSLDGTYTADTLEANQSASTYLTGEGDANIVSKITARRTGECTAEAGKAA